MLNVLSAPTYDLSGYVEIDVLPEASFVGAERRVNRVRTLDGGVVINDGGFAEGDREIVLRWQPTTQSQAEAVERLLRLYSLLNVSTRRGVFSAAPERFTPGPAENTLRLLVKTKLSPA